MGKAKKKSKIAQSLEDQQPYANARERMAAQKSGARGGRANRSYFVDLQSLEDAKRFKAVKMLCSLYAINANNKPMLEKIADAETLARLSIRLVDSHFPIRVEALGALRNLTTGSVLEATGRVVDAGIFHTITALFAEHRTVDVANVAYVEQLINCIANIISNSDTCLTQLLASTTAIQQAMDLVATEGLPVTLRLAAANLLIIATDANPPACELLASAGCCEALAVVIHHSIDMPQTATIGGGTGVAFEPYLLGLRSCGVLVNIFSCLHAVPEMFARCHIADIIARLPLLTQPDIQVVQQYVHSKAQAKAPCLDDDALDDEMDTAADSQPQGAKGEAMATKGDEQEQEQDNDEDDMSSEDATLGSTTRDAVSTASSSALTTVSPLQIIETASEILANLCLLVKESDSHDDVDDVDDDDGNWEEADDDGQMEEDSAQPASGPAAAASAAPLRIVADLVHQTGTLATLAVSAGSLVDLLADLARNVHTQPLHMGFAELVEALDRLLAAAVNVASMPTSDTNTSTITDMSGGPTATSVFLRALEFLVDALLNTSRSADHSTGAVQQPWPIDGYSESRAIPLVVIDAAATASNVVTTLTHLSSNSNGNHGASPAAATTVDFTQRMALVLMQSISVPVLEVVVSNVESVGGLAALPGYGPNICAVLTNCLLRRLAEPAAYSVQGVPLPQCPAFVMDACLDSLIDLHSGDDLETLAVYSRLGAQTKIAAALADFQQRAAASVAGGGFEKAQLRKFKETLANGRRFLKYKQSFLQR